MSFLLEEVPDDRNEKGCKQNKSEIKVECVFQDRPRLNLNPPGTRQTVWCHRLQSPQSLHRDKDDEGMCPFYFVLACMHSGIDERVFEIAVETTEYRQQIVHWSSNVTIMGPGTPVVVLNDEWRHMSQTHHTATRLNEELSPRSLAS